jgi:uncharacterized protein
MINMNKRTLIIGASDNPDRYSFKAFHMLYEHKHTVFPLSIKKGELNGIKFINDRPNIQDIDTVTMYVNPKLQEDYYDYILSLQPKRVIFNPGTENEAFEDMLVKKDIESINACTLVLLATNQY